MPPADLFALGAVRPKPGRVENDLGAVVAHEPIIAGHLPVLHDGVGDIGRDVDLDIAGPDAHQLFAVVIRHPGRRHLVAGGGALPGVLRSIEAVPGCLAARAL